MALWAQGGLSQCCLLGPQHPLCNPMCGGPYSPSGVPLSPSLLMYVWPEPCMARTTSGTHFIYLLLSAEWPLFFAHCVCIPRLHAVVACMGECALRGLGRQVWELWCVVGESRESFVVGLPSCMQHGTMVVPTVAPQLLHPSGLLLSSTARPGSLRSVSVVSAVMCCRQSMRLRLASYM
jgi:hypothetical protein